VGYQWDHKVMHVVVILCLVPLQVPKYFGLVQIFCTAPKDDLRSVNWFLCQHKRFFEKAVNAIKFFDRLKRFGLAQNILGPV
jgi:hypothetical protein